MDKIENFLASLDSSITTLSLSNRNLKVLPDSFSRFTQLIKLNLSGNKLDCLPDSIQRLNKLRMLYLSGNQFCTVPESITGLCSLSVLSLHCNQLSSVPESIVGLSTLSSLILSSNQFSKVPECVTNLRTLTTLDLSGNQLRTVPESITDLSVLTSLNIACNQLSSFPESILGLSTLMKLNLSKCQFSTLPENITRLCSLKKLYLRDNHFRTFPDSITALSHLNTLDLSHNRLKILPNNILNLTMLNELNLSFNQIRKIPRKLARRIKPVIGTSKVDRFTAYNVDLKFNFTDNPLIRPPFKVIVHSQPAIAKFYLMAERTVLKFSGYNNLFLNKLSILAIFETCVFSIFSLYVLLKLDIQYLLVFSLFTPVLLLKTKYSTESGLELLRKFNFKGMDKTMPHKNPLSALYIGLISIPIKIYATIQCLVKYPKESISNIPINFKNRTLCYDLTTPLELIPGTEMYFRGENIPCITLSQVIKTFKDTPPDNILEGVKRFLSMTILLSFHLISYWYRYALKSVAIFYLPLFWNYIYTKEGTIEEANKMNSKFNKGLIWLSSSIVIIYVSSFFNLSKHVFEMIKTRVVNIKDIHSVTAIFNSNSENYISLFPAVFFHYGLFLMAALQLALFYRADYLTNKDIKIKTCLFNTFGMLQNLSMIVVIVYVYEWLLQNVWLYLQ